MLARSHSNAARALLPGGAHSPPWQHSHPAGGLGVITGATFPTPGAAAGSGWVSGATYSEAERAAALQRLADVAAGEQQYLEGLRSNESLPVGCWPFLRQRWLVQLPAWV